MEKFENKTTSEKIIYPETQGEKLVKLKKEFELETDGLGKDIEKGILDSVVIFNAMGYNTRQSCEGHIEKTARNEVPFAWIDFEEKIGNNDTGIEYNKLNKNLIKFQQENQDKHTGDFPEYKKWEKLHDEIGEKNKQLGQRIKSVLEEFYKENGSNGFDYDIRYFDNYLPELKPNKAIEMEIKNGRPNLNPEYHSFDEEKRKEFVEKSRLEMNRISAFLQAKYMAIKH